MKLIRHILTRKDSESVVAELRRRRFSLFRDLLANVVRPVSILDVGGTQHFWQVMGFLDEPDITVTILNVTPMTTDRKNFRSVLGDATDMSQFEDGQFDVVFSNSVIEHVGDRSAQKRMAREIRRVGARFFVQTPNYYFPIEPHFLFPAYHWLPVSSRIWLLRNFDLGWYRRTRDPVTARAEVEGVRLLKKAEFLELFPGAELFCERVLGMTKSFVVYDGW